MNKIKILIIMLLLFIGIGLAVIIIVTESVNSKKEAKLLNRTDSLLTEIKDRDTIINDCLKHSAYLQGMHQNCKNKK